MSLKSVYSNNLRAFPSILTSPHQSLIPWRLGCSSAWNSVWHIADAHLKFLNDCVVWSTSHEPVLVSLPQHNSDLSAQQSLSRRSLSGWHSPVLLTQEQGFSKAEQCFFQMHSPYNTYNGIKCHTIAFVIPTLRKVCYFCAQQTHGSLWLLKII